MDPEYNMPEREDDMPPIDDELREAMEDLIRKLERFELLQKCLLLLLVMAVFIWEPFSALLLGVIGVITLAWAARLSKGAEKIAYKAYPWIYDILPYYPMLKVRGGGLPRRWGYGFTVCERIKAEAKKTGDKSTVRLIRLRERSGFWPFFGLLAFLIAAIIKIIWERFG